MGYNIKSSVFNGQICQADYKEVSEKFGHSFGAFIKQVVAEGIKIQLFSPPDNGRSFWIYEIVITSKGYPTNSGISVGDSFLKVQKAYPNIQKFPGVNENMYYVSDENFEMSIEMEFVLGKLKKLRMYYMI